MHRLVLTRIFFAIATVGAACLPAIGFAESRTPGNSQTSSEGGVTITVEPRNFSAATWDFDVSLQTHTEPLDEDLLQATTLYSNGKTYRPLGWKGSPSGGHHRKGVLRFNAVQPQPRDIELQIRRPGEPALRIFRWRLE